MTPFLLPPSVSCTARLSSVSLSGTPGVLAMRRMCSISLEKCLALGSCPSDPSLLSTMEGSAGPRGTKRQGNEPLLYETQSSPEPAGEPSVEPLRARPRKVLLLLDSQGARCRPYAVVDISPELAEARAKGEESRKQALARIRQEYVEVDWLRTSLLWQGSRFLPSQRSRG